MKKSIFALAAALSFASSARAEYLGPAIVYVLDQKVLSDLEAGYGLGDTLGIQATSQASSLYEQPLYRSFADAIGKPLAHDPKTDQLPQEIPPGSGDVPDMVRRLRGFEDKGSRGEKDLKGGFFIRHLSNNSQYPYMVEQDGDEPRHFDTRWLSSKFAQFKLVAIANRLDRSDVTRDSCGEVRFVYRLSYKSEKSSSSLPFFVNVVKQYPKAASCTEFAKRWRMINVDRETLTRGPLKDLAFRQLEVNFQSLRFTSGYMHDFGGQAMYMQRVFRKVGNALEPVGLENTPDVLAIEKDPALLKKFVEYLKKPEILKQLDQGTINIDFDPKFLAKLSVSWSTLGRAREANRPYGRLFRDRKDLLDSIDISKLEYIKTKDALVERLDSLTCMGCHQAGGTAGFHALGYPSMEFSHPFNRQQQALSPHATAEKERREAWVENVAAGKEPNRFRPHSTFSASSFRNFVGIPRFAPLLAGQLCFATPGLFAEQPVCSGDSECVRTVTSSRRNVLLGECAKKQPFRAAGGVCWKGELHESLGPAPTDAPTFNFYAFQDKWKLAGPVMANKGPYSCVLPQSGAPLGRMSRRCTIAEENFDGNMPRDNSDFPTDICANQGGQGFDMCAASGDSGACLETKVARSMLDTCGPRRACREDYICQRFPEYQRISAKDYIRKKDGKLINESKPEKIDGKKIAALHDAEIGFCVPTYFLFNMRVDGHPSPVTGKPPGEPKIDRSQPLRGYK